MIGDARMIKDLYYFYDNQFENKQARGFIGGVCSNPIHDQIMLWHKRLGHPSFSYLKCLFPNLFKGLDSNTLVCETCFLAKSHQNLYKTKPYCASKPFNLIHSDV